MPYDWRGRRNRLPQQLPQSPSSRPPPGQQRGGMVGKCCSSLPLRFLPRLTPPGHTARQLHERIGCPIIAEPGQVLEQLELHGQHAGSPGTDGLEQLG